MKHVVINQRTNEIKIVERNVLRKNIYREIKIVKSVHMYYGKYSDYFIKGRYLTDKHWTIVGDF